MIVNGVTLPDIPDKVLELSQYYIIHRMYIDTFEIYSIRVLPNAAVYFPPGMITEYGTLYSPEYYTFNLSTDGNEWIDAGFGVGELAISIGVVDGVTDELLFSNHDIYEVTSVNAETGEFTTGEIYFPNSEASHPERVSIGRSLVDGYAREVQRLTGTTDQMNAVQIREKLSTAKAGIKVGDVVLPAIPEDVLASYPYAVIASVESGGAYIGLYVLLVSTSDICIETNESEVNLTVNPSWQAYVWFPAEGVTEWTLDAESTEVKNAVPADGSDENYVPIWSNHDIYTGTVDSSTGKYTKSEVYFSERQNFNGVWLPKIPEDVLKQYPYVTILHNVIDYSDTYEENGLADINVYCLVYSAAKTVFMPESIGKSFAGEELSGFDVLYLKDEMIPYFSDQSGNHEWYQNEDKKSGKYCPVGVNNISDVALITYKVIWSNHDIYEVVSANADTGEYTTGGLYFPPLPAIDTNRISIGYDLFDSIVEEVQRLSGETDKMNALRAYWKLTTVV